MDDDLDWLYRRGRYGDGSDASTSVGAGSRPSAPSAAARAPRPATNRPVPVPTSPAQSAGAQQAPRVAQPAAPVRPAPQPAALRPPSTSPTAPRTPGLGKKRHPVRTALIGICVLAVAFVVYLIAVPTMAWSGLKHVDYIPSGDRPADQPGTLLLLAGSDSREGLTKAQQKELSTGSVGGNRTDTIMLLYMPASGKPALISLPRDSYVTIPGHSKNKLNASYAYGGPKLLTQTIEQNTGLRIDGFLEIGFGGFVGVIDAVGGIEQCPTADVDDSYANLHIKKGCQNMDGVTALKYVRYRHDDPLGDLGRANRQRAMVAAVAKKAMTPASVLNPFTYYGLNHAGAASLTAGSDTGLPQIGSAGVAFWQVSKGDGLALTIPISNPNLRTPAGSAVQWDPNKSAEMFSMIARGDTSGLDKFKK